MAILVTGGAGYIGSATVELLRRQGRDVVVLDDLYRGHRAALDADVPFYQGKVGDKELVAKIVREHKVDACLHFAALTYVGESVTDPKIYFENNVGEGMALLSALLQGGVKRFVFSSTAATYGEPQRIPIDEEHPQSPTNPYGWSKLTFERVLRCYDQAYGLRFVALRYFNAAGCTEKRGEDHDPETHLVPLVLDAASGRRADIAVFGTDYPTPDGSAIRDYVHIEDLGDAHLLALKYLENGGASDCFNLGNGNGFSVLEVIDVAKKVTGRDIPTRRAERRAGDPARLVADSTRAQSVLGWKPSRASLETIIQSAWTWREAHPKGYGG